MCVVGSTPYLPGISIQRTTHKTQPFAIAGSVALSVVLYPTTKTPQAQRSLVSSMAFALAQSSVRFMNNSNTRIPKEAIWSRKANRVVIYIALRPSIVSESNPIHKLRRKKIYREIYCEKCMCLMFESQCKYILWWNVLFDLIQLRAQ